MSLFSSSPPQARLTLRVLAHLLRYPDAAFRAHTAELQQALRTEAALPAARLAELDALLRHLATQPALDIESEYVELFDRGRRTALHLFEHVHGDSRDRGPAMIDLIQTYEKAGLFLGPNELPDYLPVVLEFISTLPAAQMRDFIGEIAHILNAVHTALVKRQSLYAHVVGAALEIGRQDIETVAVVADEDLDESWAEPEAFAGCSSKGQQSPDQPQPIQIVRRTASTPQRGASA
mgnify:CR=1 FL=1